MPENIRTRPVTADYEQGFDRAFEGSHSERRPGRSRYVWSDEAGALLEVDSDWRPADQHVPVVGDSHYDGMRATDGTDISSRTKHREYMKAHGLALASDFTDTWAKAAQERASPPADPSRRHEIGRTIYELEKRSHARKR